MTPPSLFAALAFVMVTLGFCMLMLEHYFTGTGILIAGVCIGAGAYGENE